MERESAMKPSLLLVEDDDTSAAYLRDALSGMGPAVAWVRDAAGARRAVAATPHLLWLVDAHLPDGDGITLLRELRVLRPGVPALCHTASTDRDLHRRLRQAGYLDVLEKPHGVATLREVVGRHLPTAVADVPSRYPGDAEIPAPWNDAAALAALGGRRAHVARLRALFLQELPASHRTVLAALDARDEASLMACLHRLAASCGFVGASGLGRAVARLRAAPTSPVAREHFDRECRRLAGDAVPAPGGPAP